MSWTFEFRGRRCWLGGGRDGIMATVFGRREVRRDRCGDSHQLVDTLEERRERWGLTYFTCWEEDIDLLAPVVNRLAET